ncbi:MAG TPA: WYL domain-containing protein, partial [Myxococcota bacterium]|nr:WYL domain-containing protein [Myxococcota bacterium]
RVQIVYRSATDGTESTRQVDPYGLYYRQGIWYLVGYCHLRQAERTFHVGRMVSVKATGPVGAYAVPATFDLRAHVTKRPWEFPNEAPQDVRIRLAERLRPAIPEIFGPRISLEEAAHGPIVRLRVTHTGALITAVLPYGAAAEVLGPPELRERIGAIYEALAAKYARPSPGELH